MSMGERNAILAILELDSEPDRLVERAAWIANAFDCDIHLVLFEPENTLMSKLFSISSEVDSLRREVRSAQGKIVEEYADTIRESGIVVETSVLQLRPLDDHILTIADAVKPKVVVKTTRYHSIAERSILIDTDWQLIRTCSYPLWFVKADEMPDNPVIVAVVDPGHSHDKPAALDKEIVGSANAVAAATGGEVHLVHTYEVLAELGAAVTWALKAEKLCVDEIETRMKNEHRELLDKLATENEIDVKNAHLLPGRAHEVLPAFTREKSAGVFVMGALSRWGIKKLVIGSTAERIINHLPCDTLIVRLGEYQIGE